MPRNKLKNLYLGKVLECSEGHTWVYFGCRLTTVNTLEHHFIRSDNIGAKIKPLYRVGDYWTYKATKWDTLEKKFPEIFKDDKE